MEFISEEGSDHPFKVLETLGFEAFKDPSEQVGAVVGWHEHADGWWFHGFTFLSL